MLGSLFVAFREGIDNHDSRNQSGNVLITDEDRRSKRRRKFLVSLAVLLLIGGLLIAVDQFVMSFDNLTIKLSQIWTIILERIKMIA